MNIWGKFKNIFRNRRLWRTFLIGMAGLGLILVSLFGRNIGQLFNRPDTIKAALTSPWSTHGGGYGHINRSAYAGPTTNAIKWRNDLPFDGYRGGPVIGANGIIYFVVGTKLYAVGSDGEIDWQKELNSQVWGSPSLGQNGNIYIAAYGEHNSSGQIVSGKVVAFSPTGDQLWNHSTTSWLEGSPLLTSDDRLLIGDYAGYVYCLNSNTGEEIWQKKPSPATGVITSSGTLAPDGTIYFGIGDTLYALDDTGTTKWTYDANGILQFSPAVTADGKIYLAVGSGSSEEKLQVLSSTGTKLWGYDTVTLAGTAAYSSAVMGSPAIAPDGTVYIHTLDAEVTSCDDLPAGMNCGEGQTELYGGTRGTLHSVSSTGQKNWTYSDLLVPPYWTSPIVDKNGIIYAVVEPSKIVSLRPDKTEVWNLSIGGVFATPAIGEDGILYLIGNQPNAITLALYAIGNTATPGTPGITVTPTTGTTTEAATTFDFTVVLNTAPTADVIIGIVNGDLPTLSEGIVDKTSLTFTSVNWNTPQTVRVTGVDDTEVDGDQTYTVTTVNANSEDEDYDGIDPQDVLITNIDNDTSAPAVLDHVEIVPLTATLTSGQTQTFTAVGKDATDSPLADVDFSWTATGGVLDRSTDTRVVYTAGDIDSVFEITVTGILDDISRSATAQITIIPTTETPITILPPSEGDYSEPLPSSGPESIWLINITVAALAAAGLVYRRRSLMK